MEFRGVQPEAPSNRRVPDVHGSAGDATVRKRELDVDELGGTGGRGDPRPPSMSRPGSGRAAMGIAARSRSTNGSGRRWTYCSVMTTEQCPRILESSSTEWPARTQRLAKPWRVVSCQPNPGRMKQGQARLGSAPRS
jgi:hypothetical protein